MFCNFQKTSTGFSWSADHSEVGINADKDKTKKLDTELKASPANTPANPHDNFTLSPTSATNLQETMPVGSGVQGQNPTQGQIINTRRESFCNSEIYRSRSLDVGSYGRAYANFQHTSRSRHSLHELEWIR
jgi:hypothetical protein